MLDKSATGKFTVLVVIRSGQLLSKLCVFCHAEVHKFLDS